ncbi:aspartyl-phosphate phosphatase Spo0E family protein [Bacillus sp. V5-8f]|uniref:aspartyl-phosphate phosphatase Spo0E family protein n=1 Tax=Bacillus sp. V5-8f TaxID=2053044 RepID=UPI000C774034|nr:aspartyl-phosphate phosphatase Spo0E family protein [Bacillus sp. V5-8f]PLT35610.1 sporulation stage 0, Spo0E-like regulatory phosphatase [Bacillus sp. V5-8f]
MLFRSNEKLEHRIKQLKKDLIRIVEATGLNSHETLSCSQQLDQLITVYQRNCRNEENKNRERVSVNTIEKTPFG